MRRHFEGEYRHGLVVVEAGVCRNVERKRGLADGRTGGYENELARFEPSGHPVQRRKIRVDHILGNNTRLRVLNVLHRDAESDVRTHEFLFADVFGDGIYLPFGIEQRVRAVHGLVALFRDIVARRNDAANERIALDYVGIVVAARRGRYAVRKFGEIIYAARFVEFAVLFQHIGDGHGVHGLGSLLQLPHCGEHKPVGGNEKVALPKRGNEQVRSVVVNEYRAEQRLLGFGIVRHPFVGHIVFFRHFLLRTMSTTATHTASAATAEAASTAYHAPLTGERKVASNVTSPSVGDAVTVCRYTPSLSDLSPSDAMLSFIVA